MGSNKTQAVAGRVTKIFLLGPKDRSLLEIFSNYEEALRKEGFTPLFRCAAKECGSGKPKELDSSFTSTVEQYYLAARKNRSIAQAGTDLLVDLRVLRGRQDDAQGNPGRDIQPGESQHQLPEKMRRQHVGSICRIASGRREMMIRAPRLSCTTLPSESNPWNGWPVLGRFSLANRRISSPGAFSGSNFTAMHQHR